MPKLWRSRRHFLNRLAGGLWAIASLGKAAIGDGRKQYVDVRDFGAIGDGVVDDTQAIQRAIDYAAYGITAKDSDRGFVYLPSGLFKISDTIHLGWGTSTS